MATSEKRLAPEDIRFAVIATDVVIFTILNKKLKVLLIPINFLHFKNAYGFPGGMILPHETVDDSVRRHMKAKVGIETPSYMEQLYAFSAINRDPRGRVVSVASIALLPPSRAKTVTKNAIWSDVRKLPKLAYDHNAIAEKALERLGERLENAAIGKHLLPPQFTLTELQHVHELVLGRILDKRNFRKKMLALGLLQSTRKVKTGGRSRPAELYRFAKNKGVALSSL